MRVARGIFGVAAGVAMALLTACDNGPSAVETRDRTAEAAAAEAPVADAVVQAPPEKAVLTASRRETVDAKIARLYDRNGADSAPARPKTI